MTDPLATVIVIHGYSGSPDKPRYHWLRRQLEQRGLAVDLPTMPSPGHPIEAEWLDLIDQRLSATAKPIILVGHSLGGLAVLRWLESRAHQPIFAAVSLAGVTKPLLHTTRTFSKDWQPPTDWVAIRTHAKHLVGIYSDDDWVVPPHEGDLLEQETHATMIRVSGRGHFADKDGTSELPDLLQTIDTLIQLAK